MENRKKYLLPVFFGIGTVALLLSFNIRKLAVYAQETLVSNARETTQNIKPEIPAASLVTKTASVSSRVFVASAAENNRNKSDLKWIFGGKVQNGWQIYIPLIQKEIGTAAVSDEAEFAAKLAGWQSENNLLQIGRAHV